MSAPKPTCGNGRRVSRQGPIPPAVLRSLRTSYSKANRQAAVLVRAYADNPPALIELQGEIERGADRANTIVLRAQTRAEKR